MYNPTNRKGEVIQKPKKEITPVLNSQDKNNVDLKPSVTLLKRDTGPVFLG